jgi:uncharacterized cupin superfamily protein
VYELGDGQRTHPFHFHHAEEEWLIVVAGTRRLLGQSVARVLMFSTRPSPDISICVYPDSDKVGDGRQAAATA